MGRAAQRRPSRVINLHQHDKRIPPRCCQSFLLRPDIVCLSTDDLSAMKNALEHGIRLWPDMTEGAVTEEAALHQKIDRGAGVSTQVGASPKEGAYH